MKAVFLALITLNFKVSGRSGEKLRVFLGGNRREGDFFVVVDVFRVKNRREAAKIS